MLMIRFNGKVLFAMLTKISLVVNLFSCLYNP